MQKKSQDLSPEKAKALAKSPAGQQLIRTLRNTDPEAISRAAAELEAGNYSGAQAALRDLMQNPAIRSLLKQMEE